MCPTESSTRREILSQPEVWADVLATLTDQASALRSFLTGHRFDAVLVTGCGSAYYLALAAGAALQALAGVPARGLPSSEVWLHSRPRMSLRSGHCWSRSAAPARRRKLCGRAKRSSGVVRAMS